MLDTAKLKQYITQDEEGYSLYIELDEEFAGVNITGISMFAGATNEADEGEDACYYDGDLAVSWDMAGLQNDETAQTMGMLLLRNVHSEDDVTKVMGQFYWEQGFDKRLQEILLEAGFSADAVEGVHTSEWGMQDEERASYDAFEIAGEIRKAMA
jgi:hypothetical protein